MIYRANDKKAIYTKAQAQVHRTRATATSARLATHLLRGADVLKAKKRKGMFEANRASALNARGVDKSKDLPT